MQQGKSSEQDLQGEVSDTAWSVYLKPGEEIDTSDALEIDGYRYEMVADPWEVRNPSTGLVSHIECLTRIAKGAGVAS